MIHDVDTENMGALCVTEPYRSLRVPLATSHYEGAQQKADMAAMLLQDLGVSHHNGTQTPDIAFLPAFLCFLAEVLPVRPTRQAPPVRHEARKRQQTDCVHQACLELISALTQFPL